MVPARCGQLAPDAGKSGKAGLTAPVPGECLELLDLGLGLVQAAELDQRADVLDRPLRQPRLVRRAAAEAVQEG